MRQSGESTSPSSPSISASPAPAARSDWATLSRLFPYLWEYKWRVMAQVDLAGSVIPARHAQGRMATVAVNEFVFKQPVRVGDILSFFASLTRIGRTSITVQVEVYAERFQAQGQYIKVTEASLTYVAIDDTGKPRPIATQP